MIPLVIASIFLCLGDPSPVATATAKTQTEFDHLSGGIDEGELIRIEEHPAMASILDGEYHGCAGSIISESIVLTTVQCTKDNVENLSVRVGSSIANEGGSRHKVIAIRHHEKYQRFQSFAANDLALLKVSPPFKLNRNVRKIPLIEKNETVVPYMPLKVAGWMATPFNTSMMLREANLRVEECPKKSIFPGTVTEKRFCAVPLYKNAAEVCQGDLGGPVTVANYQVGIISWGKRCISNQDPRVFTSLVAYRDWIDTNVRIMERIVEGTVLSTFLKQNVLPNLLTFWKW